MFCNFCDELIFTFSAKILIFDIAFLLLWYVGFARQESSLLCYFCWIFTKGHIKGYLYNLLCFPDLNQIDNLFQEFDDMLVPNLSSENSFALLDASAILWRLNVSSILFSSLLLAMHCLSDGSWNFIKLWDSSFDLQLLVHAAVIIKLLT